VEITIYEDRSFEFKLKTSPAADLLKKQPILAKDQPNQIERK